MTKSKLPEIRNSVQIGDIYSAKYINHYIVIIEKHNSTVDCFSISHKRFVHRTYQNISQFWEKIA